MTDAEILVAALEKAIKQGLDEIYGIYHIRVAEQAIHTGEYYSDIFSHDFARAFWGEATKRVWKCPKCSYWIEYMKHNEGYEYCPSDGRKLQDVTKPLSVYEQTWGHHLQMMVLEQNPLKYLEQFLE